MERWKEKRKVYRIKKRKATRTINKDDEKDWKKLKKMNDKKRN